jgi:hypothetical protein
MADGKRGVKSQSSRNQQNFNKIQIKFEKKKNNQQTMGEGIGARVVFVESLNSSSAGV